MPDSSPKRPAVRTRRWPRIVMLVAVVTATGGGAWYFWDANRRASDELSAQQFVSVTRGAIEDVVTATGTLQPREHVDVGAQVSGVLTRIHVEVGSEVSEGDLLVEIDPTVLQSRVDATHAQLRNQRAQLTDRESSLQLAQIQLRRQRNLIAEDATTEEAVQTAEATLRSALAQIDALKAQIDQTESNLRADEANLAYSRIFAPMSGTVVSITARQGQTINASQQAPTILRVADLSTMTVQAQVSEADVTRLRNGMDVYFTTLGNTGQRWSSALHKIEPTPTITNNVVLYNALFDVPNPDRRLMTQMTAQVFFVVARADDTLTVPMAALSGLTPPRTGGGSGGRALQGGGPPANGVAVAAGDAEAKRERGGSADQQTGAHGDFSDARQASVSVLRTDGRIEERSVLIGVTSRIAAQVLSGLEEGDRVLLGRRLPAAAARAAAGGGPRPALR